jgi:hypothetical protein
MLLGGVAMWRRVADAIRLDIVGGKLARGDRLAGEPPSPHASASTATPSAAP